jgi:feruloyl esterase
VNHGFRGPGATPTGVNEALIRWVEKGEAPEKLIAEKRDASRKVIRTRPLFPYPEVAKYKGRGSTDEEKNFDRKKMKTP